MRIINLPVLVSVGLISFITSLTPANAQEDSPGGYLFNQLAGESLQKDYGITVGGWAQAGLIYNDNGTDDVGPQGFFNSNEGFNLNQLALQIKKEPTSNVIARVGPFPGPKPEAFSAGFTFTTLIGRDGAFFKTLGIDDDLNLDDDDAEQVVFNEFFLDLYLPFLGGTNLIIGSFHTPILNEIGFPFDPPTAFYTHSYSFMHGPAKHVGALLQSKLPIPQHLGLLSLEFGPVLGWNNFDNENDDLMYITSLRWRSPQLRTWVDIEAIFGNGENDFGPAPATGGSPYFALSSTGESLNRFHSDIVITHNFTDSFRAVTELTYGMQEGGDLAPTPMFITEDSEWYGTNLNLFYDTSPNVDLGLRAEWFRDENGAHVLLTGSPGDYFALTGNVSWQLNRFVRIRPEIRYDIYDGDGAPPFANNTEDSQFIAAISAFLRF